MAKDTAVNYAGDDRTIGRRLRAVRLSRKLSLRVVAGLVGISATHLSRIERGQSALDRLSLIVALADVLRIAPSELVRLPIPAPANGHTDSAIEAVRHALLAVMYGHPEGQVQPAEILRERVNTLVTAACQCDQSQVGATLPTLMRDMHASIGAGRDVAELLDLAVLLHSQVTWGWLWTAGAPVDLCSQVAGLAVQVAQHRDTPTTLGLATVSTARVAVMTGAFDLARTELGSVTVSTSTPEGMQLAGFRALRESALAATDSRPGDVAAPLAYAGELAARTGEGDAYGCAFGPFQVARYRMVGAVGLGDWAQAVSIAESLNPQVADELRRAYFYADYGRALARVRGRRDHAVVALRRAERLYPHHVLRNPLVREVLAELNMHAKHDAIGRELRGMAYRAGLPV